MPRNVYFAFNKPLAIVGLIGILTSGFAHAQYIDFNPKSGSKGGIYKSVDAAGKVFYSNRPVDGLINTKQLKDEARPTLAAVSATTPTTPATPASAIKDVKATLDANAKTIEALNANAAKKDCNDARQSLSNLSTGRRVLHVNDKGQPEVLTAAQIADQRSASEERISQNCK